jgi:Beta-propeller repeat
MRSRLGLLFVFVAACADSTRPTPRDAAFDAEQGPIIDADAAAALDGAMDASEDDAAAALDADASRADGSAACSAGQHVAADACVADNECPLGCSGQGACSAALCTCNEGYAGSGCEQCASGYHRGADARTCTRSYCDPNPCGQGVCQPLNGACCVGACTLGETACSGGQVRTCVSNGNCPSWSAPVACGAAGCSDSKQCAPLAPGVRVDQWGTTMDDGVNALAARPSGEVIAVGFLGDALNGLLFVGKVDLMVSSRHTDPAQSWTRLQGSAGVDILYAAALSTTGELFAAGRSDGALVGVTGSGAGALLSKWNTTGDLVWGRRAGEAAGRDAARALALGTDGSVYVAGSTYENLQGMSAGEEDAFVLKLDRDGKVVWSAQWGTAGRDQARGLAIDAQGNVYTAGITDGVLAGPASFGDQDAYLIKHSPSGNRLWARQWGSAAADWAEDVDLGPDGSVYVAGAAGDLGRSGSGGAYLGKWDPAGNELWIQQWGSGAAAFALSVDANQAIYVAGAVTTSIDGQAHAGGYDAFVSKWTQGGATATRAWSRLVGTDADDEAHDVKLVSGGTVVLGGTTHGSFPGFLNQGTTDAFIVRITAP